MLLLLCGMAGWGVFKLHCWRGNNPLARFEFELPEGADVRTIDRAEAERMANHGEVLVIDARASLFYERGHLPGAISLPREKVESGASDVAALLRKKNKKAFLVYCSNTQCEDSKRVAFLLHRQGIRPILIYAGGWDEWNGRHEP
jgi:rhodanese-related sulfurtransferase